MIDSSACSDCVSTSVQHSLLCSTTTLDTVKFRNNNPLIHSNCPTNMCNLNGKLPVLSGKIIRNIFLFPIIVFQSGQLYKSTVSVSNLLVTVGDNLILIPVLLKNIFLCCLFGKILKLFVLRWISSRIIVLTKTGCHAIISFIGLAGDWSARLSNCSNRPSGLCREELDKKGDNYNLIDKIPLPTTGHIAHSLISTIIIQANYYCRHGIKGWLLRERECWLSLWLVNTLWWVDVMDWWM